jgi:hypothetical protein
MSLASPLLQLALGALAGRPLARRAGGLVAGLIGLLAALLLALMALASLLLALLLWLMPPGLTWPGVLAVLAAILFLLAGVVWLAFSRGRSTRRLLAEAFPPSPLERGRTLAEHIADAFSRGWRTAE